MRVHADSIDNNFITYKCSKCGLFHQHGSNGLLYHRIEERITHCPTPFTRNRFYPVEIVIDETTKGSYDE